MSAPSARSQPVKRNAGRRAGGSASRGPRAHGRRAAAGPAIRRWRETKAARQARAAEIVRRLHLAFPDAAAELDFQAPFQLLIAVILSAQTTDVAVNKVTPELFARYPTPAALAAAGQAEVEAIVHATGFFRSKARAIRETAAQLVRDFDGEVPRTMEGLLRLRGVARKTANVVLGEAFRLPTGIVVDTHVKRLSQRLGLSVQTDPVKIERDLMAMAPQDEWIFAGIALIWHGRRVCDARRPACERCTLNDVCPSSTTPSRPAESPFRSAPSPPPGSVD